MSTPSKSVNAWILPSEDEPSGTSYQSPNSSYQSLITYGVYNYLDMVNICFADTLPTSGATVPTGDGSTYTIQLTAATHPDGYTNQDYMNWIIQDARQANPNIKVLITLGYAADEFTQIFSGDQSQWPAQAASYANNVVAYLKNYGLNGFDIDWESPFSGSTPADQVSLVLTALRTAFNAQPEIYYLTLSPATAQNLQGSFVNNTVDFLNLQLYSGFTDPGEFTQADISQSLLAYGAKFESIGNGDTNPYQDAQGAYQGMVSGGYGITTQWRLNSGDFQFEQAQQMILYELVYGIPGTTFDDTPIIGAAGNPLISQLVIRSGEVLDAIQATNTGAFEGNTVQYILLQHGGNGGNPSTVAIPSGDAIVEVSGYTGVWFGWDCVLQITIKTRGGKTFGPFGTMSNASSKTPFTYTAPSGQSLVAFSGSIVNVPLAGGGMTYIIASLTPSYA
jgi:hypothetical protein